VSCKSGTSQRSVSVLALSCFAPTILRRGSCLPITAWSEGLIFALLWGVPFALLVALGLKLTLAVQAASIAPTLMPV
jgi:hypothetical protein